MYKWDKVLQIHSVTTTPLSEHTYMNYIQRGGRCCVWSTFGHDGSHEFSIGFFSCQKGQALQRQFCQLRAPPAIRNIPRNRQTDKQADRQTGNGFFLSVKGQVQDRVEGRVKELYREGNTGSSSSVCFLSLPASGIFSS